jgi:hypothetical protein
MRTPAEIFDCRLQTRRWKGCPSAAAALRALSVLLSVVAPGAQRLRAEEVVAIAAKVSNGYARQKLPDGTFQVETYAFGKGDDWSGARVDASADKLDFMTVARTVAIPLSTQNYLPTHDQKTTRLLIMVYWGTTKAPEYATHSNALRLADIANREQDQAAMATVHALSSQGKGSGGNPGDVKVAKLEQASADADMRAALEGLQAENQRREDTDAKTVALLGYDSWWLKTEQASGGGERALRKADMLNEIEEDRYFVVLMAYDFQAMTRRKSKLLWEVHMSVREHSNEFDQRLPGMAAQAAAFLGRDSGGLNHLILPEGTVEIGAVRSLGALPEK